jgi:DNA-binding transcriptional MerR regulator
MREIIYLTEKQVAQKLNISPRTLQAWRRKHVGPPYVRLSPRAIRYELTALLQWLEEQRVLADAAGLALPVT